jgi:molybdopterin-guanine dinucleotide biosynthesis protein A
VLPTLAILAGGRGRRLGGLDKGRLLYQGRPLLDRLIDLGALCSATLVVREDVVPAKGAPGGVVTALLTAKTALVLIVCCDMPRVSPEAVRALLDVNGPACFGGQPFPAVYETGWGPGWRARLEAGNPSMHELMAGVTFTRVPLVDPDVVRSVNTIDDARALGVDIP